MKKVLFLLLFTCSCSKPKTECDKPDTFFVDSIGGCDFRGVCGVQLVRNRDGALIHDRMRYPILGAVLVNYKHCYVPYQQPNWMKP